MQNLICNKNMLPKVSPDQYLSDCYTPVIVHLLYDKDLAFCYVLLRYDKIRQSDNNYKKFQNSVSRKCQVFKEFLDYTYHGFPFLYISS